MYFKTIREIDEKASAISLIGRLNSLWHGILFVCVKRVKKVFSFRKELDGFLFQGQLTARSLFVVLRRNAGSKGLFVGVLLPK